jgi:protein phosphatase
MGGHSAGEIASHMAVDLINRSFCKWTDLGSPEEVLFGKPDPSLSLTGNYVLSSVRLANRVIYEVAGQRERYYGMGTTVAVLAITPKLIITANVGDSRIYMVGNGKIERLSEDHTMVAKQVELGIITKQQAEDSPLKHVLTRNLGSSEDLDAEVFEIERRGGFRFVLCTDGLTDLVSDEEILALAEKEADPEVLCRSLVEKALSRGGGDNTTVVSVFLDGGRRPGFGFVKKVGSLLKNMGAKKGAE